MNVLRFFKLFQALVRKLQNTMELAKYDNLTIAEYFRKQGAHIGERCYIVPRSLCTEPYLLKIGNHVLIAQGVVFHTHDGGTWVFREEMAELRVFGPIVVEDNSIIGANSQILPNVTIGRNSIVGTGSVVITDVPPDSLVMGVPARKMGSVDKYREKCIERWKEQKPSNLHSDYMMPFWETSKNKQIILNQMKEHLLSLFKDKLG